MEVKRTWARHFPMSANDAVDGGEGCLPNTERPLSAPNPRQTINLGPTQSRSADDGNNEAADKTNNPDDGNDNVTYVLYFLCKRAWCGW